MFGVVNVGRRLSVRIPVSFRTVSSRATPSAFAALRRFRFARGSGMDSAAIAR